ncbi:hypothetical protein B0T22DRAFT_449131 [Podospora appendiculata]|uniref:Stc1 domain-containing protein n=1 Tax=Podospora appendiculata TaxID=314037 RepID=A0AAE1CG16_9PEZI|nr:hypothetical protein B0T22DRAFT_449131 [Podospora appendiculata]
MPKTTRTSTYCPTCQATWNAWPDEQCPPEWRLLAPRTDCRHAMALECFQSPVGQAWCCACNDRRKFLGTQERVASYCQPCRSRWERARVDEVPVAWTVGVSGLPERVEDERGRLREWVVRYEGEDDEGQYTGIGDEGPRYGAPRFGGKDDDKPPGPGMGAGKFMNLPKRKPIREPPRSKTVAGDGGDLMVSSQQQEVGAGTDYSGYEDKGPQRQGPRFSVPATVAIIPKSSSPSPAAVAQTASEKPGQGKNASSGVQASQEDIQRQKDREGLCVGRQPRFMVPVGT